MKFIERVADNQNKESLSHQFRKKRFQLFLSKIQSLPKPVSILDIGGTVAFWENMGFSEEGVTITLLNLKEQEITQPGFISVAGDATQLPYADQSFDMVFSNSVIEHLYTKEKQQQMAAEVQRVGKHFFIQTPNYWFPVEPHWVFPFFQFLPFSVRVFLTQHFSLGHIAKQPLPEDAKRQVREIKLLSKREFQSLFPAALIYTERFLLMGKSFVAMR